MARHGAVLIFAFLGAREIHFGSGGESYCKEAIRSSAPAMELPLRHAEPLQVPEQVPGLCCVTLFS